MEARVPQTRLTYAEYLAVEAAAPVKHEFVGGELLIMAGRTRAHGDVLTGIVGLLVAHLRGKPCRPSASESRVYFPAYGDSAYPDAHVICGPSIRADVDREAVTNPTLVVEVLSPGTELWDRGGKFERYESLPSLLEYILVTVDRRRVEVFRREPGGPFTRYVFVVGQEVEFRSIKLTFPIGEIYAIADAENAGADER